MSIAEIHGKTPFTYYEDILTADVFAAFRYLPTQLGIYAFICSIPGLSQKLPQLAGNENITCTFHFWPFGEKHRREPDVLLALQVGPRLFHIVVEAKYMSGASDLEIQEIEQEGVVQRVGNQLGDQLRDLQHGRYRLFQEGQRVQPHNLRSDPADRYLVYLTAHLLKPAEIQRALAIYPAADGRLFWANWYQVFEHLQKLRPYLQTPPYSLILQDICLLLDRKGFASFHGFRPLLAGHVHSQAASFWTEKIIDYPLFAGIALPPDFVVQPTSAHFWSNE
ncbi:MAG: hypothetical protein IPJ94_11500 [Chloroflexi bacterium]|nr:hypothetical protein [Chloroflexota bacterium]MBP6473435.1 hypothetical protein [Chloroflexota bacterium]